MFLHHPDNKLQFILSSFLISLKKYEFQKIQKILALFVQIVYRKNPIQLQQKVF